MTEDDFLSVTPLHPLYKFRPVNENTVRILLHTELYFATALQFNDPFDCLPRVETQATIPELRSYLDSQMKAESVGWSQRRKLANTVVHDPNLSQLFEGARKEAVQGLAEVRATTGVLALSASPDHMLLWSHYADSHKGICLRFQPVRGDRFFEMAMPIKYSIARPVINPTIHNNPTMFDLTLMTKADFWSYEQEWRLISHRLKPGPHKYPATALNGIILGANISREDEKHVRELADPLGSQIEWLRATIDEHDYRLNLASA